MSATGLLGLGLSKTYPGGVRALEDVTFRVAPGTTLALLGPSGCGKSTLLRIVAGLEEPTSGRLELDGRPLDGLEPGERDVGFVFQNYALYPHLTVAGNLLLGMRARGTPRAEAERRARETAAMLGIEDLLDRRPAQLSGGQQQRVALGRALVRRPRLYLLDEPLSNLDAARREATRSELKRLFGSLSATVLYVTHDASEAMALADEVLVLAAGRALQSGPPLELYRRPAHRSVAEIVGAPRPSVWTARAEGEVVAAGGLRLPRPPGLPPGDVLVAIRPEDVGVGDAPSEGAHAAEVLVAEPAGAHTLLTLDVGGVSVRALAPSRPWPARVWAALPPERLHWFDVASGRRRGP